MTAVSDKPDSTEETSPEVGDLAQSSPSHYFFGGNVYYAEGL